MPSPKHKPPPSAMHPWSGIVTPHTPPPPGHWGHSHISLTLSLDALLSGDTPANSQSQHTSLPQRHMQVVCSLATSPLTPQSAPPAVPHTPATSAPSAVASKATPVLISVSTPAASAPASTPPAPVTTPTPATPVTPAPAPAPAASAAKSAPSVAKPASSVAKPASSSKTARAKPSATLSTVVFLPSTIPSPVLGKSRPTSSAQSSQPVPPQLNIPASHASPTPASASSPKPALRSSPVPVPKHAPRTPASKSKPSAATKIAPRPTRPAAPPPLTLNPPAIVRSPAKRSLPSLKRTSLTRFPLSSRKRQSRNLPLHDLPLPLSKRYCPTPASLQIPISPRFASKLSCVPPERPALVDVPHVTPKAPPALEGNPHVSAFYPPVLWKPCFNITKDPLVLASESYNAVFFAGSGLKRGYGQACTQDQGMKKERRDRNDGMTSPKCAARMETRRVNHAKRVDDRDVRNETQLGKKKARLGKSETIKSEVLPKSRNSILPKSKKDILLTRNGIENQQSNQSYENVNKQSAEAQAGTVAKKAGTGTARKSSSDQQKGSQANYGLDQSTAFGLQPSSNRDARPESMINKQHAKSQMASSCTIISAGSNQELDLPATLNVPVTLNVPAAATLELQLGATPCPQHAVPSNCQSSLKCAATPTTPSSAVPVVVSTEHVRSHSRQEISSRSSDQILPQFSSCHVCLKKETPDTRHKRCANFSKRNCGKVTCGSCVRSFDIVQIISPIETWTCLHCRDMCPPQAACRRFDVLTSSAKEKKIRDRLLGVSRRGKGGRKGRNPKNAI